MQTPPRAQNFDHSSLYKARDYDLRIGDTYGCVSLEASDSAVRPCAQRPAASANHRSRVPHDCHEYRDWENHFGVDPEVSARERISGS